MLRNHKVDFGASLDAAIQSSLADSGTSPSQCAAKEEEAWRLLRAVAELPELVKKEEKDWRPSQVLAELAELPELVKEAVLLKYIKRLSPSEIAKRLGRSEDLVKEYLKKGRQKLLHLLGTSSTLFGSLASPEEIAAAAKRVLDEYTEDERRVLVWIQKHKHRPSCRELADLLRKSEDAARKWQERHKSLHEDFQKKVQKMLDPRKQRKE
jgi:DNA-directed RNA polymerase specialized sigma24 family protein